MVQVGTSLESFQMVTFVESSTVFSCPRFARLSKQVNRSSEDAVLCTNDRCSPVAFVSRLRTHDDTSAVREAPIQFAMTLCQ